MASIDERINELNEQLANNMSMLEKQGRDEEVNILMEFMGNTPLVA